jgi:hypothetical protein
MRKSLTNYSARLRELEQMLERIADVEREQETQGVYNLIERARGDELREKYWRMLDELRRDSGDLEKMIDELDEPGLRLLLRERYLCGGSWARCARLAGYAGESGARMRVKRFLAGVVE